MRKLIPTAFFASLTFLVVCCVFANGHSLSNSKEKAEAIRGKVEMDLPDTPTPKVKIDLDQAFFNMLINFGVANNPKLSGNALIDLSEYAAYAEMLKGAAIRAYDKKAENLNQIMEHYQGVLENEKWEHLVKIKDTLNLSLLYAEELGIVHGIFVMVNDDDRWSFVNIYGEIDFEKLGVLFGQFLESNSEESISETVSTWINAPMPQWLNVKLNSKLNLEKLNDTPKPETETGDHSK